jgi:hypothetical protein
VNGSALSARCEIELAEHLRIDEVGDLGGVDAGIPRACGGRDLVRVARSLEEERFLPVLRRRQKERSVSVNSFSCRSRGLGAHYALTQVTPSVCAMPSIPDSRSGLSTPVLLAPPESLAVGHEPTHGASPSP